MTAIPAISRLRRASDDEILAERLEPPYTPLRWPGGALEPPTEVYAEVIDTDGQIHATPVYTTPDPARLRWHVGDAPIGTYARPSAAMQRGEDGEWDEVAPEVLRDSHWIGGERTALIEEEAQNRVADNAALHTWLTPVNTVLSPTTLLGLPAVRIDGTAEEGGRGAYRNNDLIGSSEAVATYSLYLRAHPDIAAVRLGGRAGFFPSTSGTLDIDLRTLDITFNDSTGTFVAAHASRIAPDLYRVEYTIANESNDARRRFMVAFSDSSGAFTEGSAVGLWVEIAGLQVELAARPTSPVLTYGTPTTRAADVWTIPLPAGGLYERYLDPWTGTATDTLTPQPGGIYTVPTGRAYTDILVVPEGYTLADARHLAGVTP